MAGLNPSSKRTKFGDCLICYNKYKTETKISPSGSSDSFSLKLFSTFLKYFGVELTDYLKSWNSLPFCHMCLPCVEELSFLNIELEEIQAKINKLVPKIKLKFLESLEAEKEFSNKEAHLNNIELNNRGGGGKATISKQKDINALRNEIIQGVSHGFQDLSSAERQMLFKKIQIIQKDPNKFPRFRKSIQSDDREDNTPSFQDDFEQCESLDSISSMELKVEEFSPQPSSVSSFHEEDESQESDSCYGEIPYQVEQPTIYGGIDIDTDNDHDDNSHDGIGLEVSESNAVQLNGSSSSQSSVVFGNEIKAVNVGRFLSKSAPQIDARCRCKVDSRCPSRRPPSQNGTEQPLRRKVQNREASARFRLKRKKEQVASEGVIQELEETRRLLEAELDSLCMDIVSTLREIFRDKYPKRRKLLPALHLKIENPLL